MSRCVPLVHVGNLQSALSVDVGFGLLCVQIVHHHDTGKSRGFGFLTFERSPEHQHAAEDSIKALNGKEMPGAAGRKRFAPSIVP